MEFVGNIGLQDVAAAWQGAQKLEANPVKFAARLAGLGTSELEAGIPTWAWVTIAFGAGALATYLWSDTISDKIRGIR